MVTDLALKLPDRLAIGRYNQNPVMDSFLGGFYGRTLLVILITLAAAGLLLAVYLFAPLQLLPDALYGWAAVGILGLTSGFSARFLLAGSAYVKRILAALLGLVISLIVFVISLVLIGSYTQAGIPLELENRTAVGFDPVWSLPLMVGIGFSLLASWTWRLGSKSGKSTRIKKRKSASKPKTRLKKSARVKPRTRVKTGSASSGTRASKKPRISRASSSRKGAKKTKISPKTGASSAKRASTSRRRTASSATRRSYWAARLAGIRSATRNIFNGGLRTTSRASRRPSIQRKSTSWAVNPKSLTRRKRIKGQNVNLTSVIEHRCPYCLEEVVVNDPRGVRICPDCGTRHHRDCWNVTGSCQVPHD